MKINPYNLDPFTRAYAECALWASNDESTPSGGEPMDKNYSIENLSQDALKRMIEDCEKFKAENNLGRIDMGRAGHCFWLSRNGHGTGFFDEHTIPEEDGERLQDASHKFGEVNLFVENGVIDFI
jgi:hypothetical protein